MADFRVFGLFDGVRLQIADQRAQQHGSMVMLAVVNNVWLRKNESISRDKDTKWFRAYVPTFFRNGFAGIRIKQMPCRSEEEGWLSGLALTLH
jgi:hypothetical protein